MEEKINIAEILKDKPKGIIILYSPIFGECAFLYIQNTTDDICVKKHNNEKAFFNSEGLYNTLGECLLFPSKKMRDWRKFTWKRGDVLVSNDSDSHIIFEGFSKDDYTTFEGKHWINVSKKRHISYLNMQKTQCYHIEDDKDAAQTYINAIEEHLGVKLNRETLEIEKALPEFKDGDVLFVRCEKYSYIEIFNYSKENSDLYDHASLNTTTQKLDISGKFKICKDGIVEIRLATEEEKKQLFSAFAKEGKAWDAEKKQIVDLKPKIELKPFDKVLVRDSESDKWRANLFGYIDKDENYHCVYANWVYCIPYAGNEHLLGTTKDVED